MSRVVQAQLFFGLLIAALAFPGSALGADEGGSKLESEKDQTLYVLGVLVGKPLEPFGLSEQEFEMLSQGLRDAALSRELRVDPLELQEDVLAFQQARLAARAEGERKASRAFLDEAAKQPGALRTESGMIIREIVAGSGDSPQPTSVVKVHYQGALRDGTIFDSTRATGTPATFSLERVIRCWQEGLTRMKVGGKSELLCPAQLAYGDSGMPPAIPAGAALHFEVELLEIVR